MTDKSKEKSRISATILFEQISEATFPDLKELVQEQAANHAVAYSGDDKKFVEALTRQEAVPQILMVRNDDTQEPLGYILFNHYHGFKGYELYIEDILVSNRTRSQGFGLVMTEELKAFGREMGIDRISWAVAENNPQAIRFYEAKMMAQPLDDKVYDCGNLYVNPLPIPEGMEVRRVGNSDIDLLESYIGIIPALTKEKLENIRAAAAHGNTNVYIAEGTDGVPKALGITNSNYSSFRTVYGYKLEIMELTDDVQEGSKALKALTSQVINTGKSNDHAGHLNIYINEKSPVQSAFIRDIGTARLQMSDDPASVFALYAIGRDILYAPQAKNAINMDVSKKKPEGPKAP